MAANKEETVKPNVEEQQYLKLIERIIDNGKYRLDRTKVGTRAVFGTTMRFDLSNNKLPLLTTKRTFWRGIAVELLWIISGATDAKTLNAQRIKFWNANGTREFLDNRGLTEYEVGDLGPVYGFQWRHFGAKYVDCHTDYTGQGVDQLANCIKLLKTNPYSRRIIMSAWNPADLDKMALPPCHMFCQFFVHEEDEIKYLSCQLYQRSGDMGLGVPFNIASYALLTHLVAQICGMKAYEFIHVIGDTHVYVNHIEPLAEQLKRDPYPFPTLEIDSSITDIDDFKYEHLKLKNYKCHRTIKMDMAT